MKTTITETMFIDSFKAIRPDNFSYNGLRALFEYLEQLEEDCGTEMELDVIALCCDFSEYGHPQELAGEYGKEMSDEEVMEWLYDNTHVIEFEGGIIVSAF